MNGGVHGAQRSMNGHEEKDLKLTLSEGRRKAAEGSPPGGLGRTFPRADITKREEQEQRHGPAYRKGLRVQIINLPQVTAGREHRILHHTAADKKLPRHNCHQKERWQFLREEHKGRAINVQCICHGYN